MDEPIDDTPDACARALLEMVPSVMRFIRTEMRSHRGSALTVPQFRSLAYVDRNPDASLGQLAEHLGLTAASTSVLVDGLVARELLTRASSPTDRRRLALALTQRGRKLLVSARSAAQARLAAELSAFSAADRGAIVTAMKALGSSFGRAAQTRAEE